jgi:hypothetical protein
MVYIGRNKNYLEYIKLQIEQLDIHEDYREHIKLSWLPVIG